MKVFLGLQVGGPVLLETPVRHGTNGFKSNVVAHGGDHISLGLQVGGPNLGNLGIIMSCKQVGYTTKIAREEQHVYQHLPREHIDILQQNIGTNIQVQQHTSAHLYAYPRCIAFACLESPACKVTFQRQLHTHSPLGHVSIISPHSMHSGLSSA